MPSNPTLPDDVRAVLCDTIEHLPNAFSETIIDAIAPLIIEWAQREIFAALDGEGISYLVGTDNRGREYRVGGIGAFVPTNWETPPGMGEPWDSLTIDQKLECAKFSAQHALIKRLADIRAQFSPATTEEPPMTTSVPTPDPRETEHIECNCVPELGPSHCHLCGERAGHPVAWSEAHSDPKVEEIRDPREMAEAYVEVFTRFEGDDESAITWTLKGLLTKLDEAEKDLKVMVGRFDRTRERMIAAEERERTLIAGVREALEAFEHSESYWDGERFLLPAEYARTILSRLLPSTPTEEGKGHE